MLLLCFVLNNDNETDIGPIRPIYINKIKQSLLPTEKNGVTPVESPTVAKALKASNT